MANLYQIILDYSWSNWVLGEMHKIWEKQFVLTAEEWDTEVDNQ